MKVIILALSLAGLLLALWGYHTSQNNLMYLGTGITLISAIWAELYRVRDDLIEAIFPGSNHISE